MQKLNKFKKTLFFSCRKTVFTVALALRPTLKLPVELALSIAGNRATKQEITKLITVQHQGGFSDKKYSQIL